MNDTFHVSHRKTLLIATFLLVVVLASSCFVSAFSSSSSVSFFVLGASDKVVVRDETELIKAVNNTQPGSPIVIALDKDITLNAPLTISANKDITLTSNKANGFFKLIGAEDTSTITVKSGGVLRLDGIIVTHANGAKGIGVYVIENGQCIMNNGEISGNTYPYDNYAYPVRGGGMFNQGLFELHGGKISNNKAYSDGGGVFNSLDSTFKMFGGEISNNRAFHSSDGATFSFSGNGGGVYNHGIFELHGGKISNNIADGDGGGVYMQMSFGEATRGVFKMFGGTISGNTANRNGGGVYSVQGGGLFGGTISGNTAGQDGGGVYWSSGYLGEWGVGVFGNTAKSRGNDVYPEQHDDGTSNGNGGSSDGNSGDNGLNNGNNGSPDGGGDGSPNNDGNGPFVWEFSVGTALVICVIAIAVVMGIIVTVLFVYFQKKIKQIEKKQNNSYYSAGDVRWFSNSVFTAGNSNWLRLRVVETKLRKVAKQTRHTPLRKQPETFC